MVLFLVVGRGDVWLLFDVTLNQVINQFLRENGIVVDPVFSEVLAALIFFGLAVLVGFLVYHFIEKVLMRLAKKTATTLDDEIIKNVKRPIYFLVMLVGFYYGVYQITSLMPYEREIGFVFMALEIFLVAFIFTRIINVFVAWYVERQAKTQGKVLSINIITVFRKLLHFLVYVFAFMALLLISGVDLTGTVVGLGVGGIAIAFALQNVLTDVFSAFFIYFDKPFEIGDFIQIGEFGGTVSHVSMRSTRIRTVQGEELVVSNKAILEKNIQNFKRLKERTVTFRLSVAYGTPVEKLRRVRQIVTDVVGACPQTKLLRVHLKSLAEYSLVFEGLYTIDSPDYTLFMDIQEQFNYGVLEAFRKEGIALAFPTQTVEVKYLAESPKKAS
jgi:small-conductance mechanosensitive channel